ncbi:MAG: DUF4091 domain-containing protein [Kiritimatiellaeota bacterium]|nr:DUF4091 domain-containing protein [Kiritimatiellota bacterium]
MNRKRTVSRAFATMCGVCAAASVWSVELRLLTENGLTNSANRDRTYANAPILRTGGTYMPRPAFASEPRLTGPIPFGTGRLTNGDTTFSWKRKPPPYSYWRNRARGSVVFDLKKPYRIRRVRVRLLESGPHGTEDIELFRDDNPLEFPDLLKVAELRAHKDWNTFDDLDLVTDRLRLRFTLARGKQYITFSEVEIWGEPAPENLMAKPRPRRSRQGKSIFEGTLEWYAYDFGPAEAPAFANFTPVSNATRYTAEQGYGWVPYRNGNPVTASNFGPASKTVPGLHERDRAKGKATFCDSLYRDFVMTARYYHTQVRQTFRVDLPDGRYRVRTWHGDMQYGRPGLQPWWIEVGGRRVVERCVMPTTLRTAQTFDVDVRGGRLDITFDARDPDPARCGFLVDGLVILPFNDAGQQAFANKKLAQIEAAIERERDERFREVFIERPHTETAAMPPVAAADRARGFVVFVPNWMTNIYPNSVPRPKDLSRALACFACPDEYEPVAVALRALRELRGTACQVSDLVGPKAARLPATTVDVRVVRCWPQRLGSSWSTEWCVMPELLEHRSSVNVPANETKEFWLIVHVPAGTAPGVYRGTLTLRTSNAGKKNLPFSVEVLPFRLRPNKRPIGMYWRDDAPPDVRRKQVRDMLAHGVTAVAIGRTFPKLRDRNGKLLLDAADLLALLRDLHRLGVRGPIPFEMGRLMSHIRRLYPGRKQEEYDALYVEGVRRLQAISTRPDTPQLLFYPVDEIGNSEDRGRKAHDECALIRRVPGAVSYITVNNYKAGEKWGDTFDIWCGNIVYTPEQEKKLLARGKRYMRYGSAYLNDPRKTRSSSGFGFYIRPAEAMYYWHYQYPTGDPFNDFDGAARDWCAAYPGPNGDPIPTTDWEGIREGVDDMRYIATLKYFAEQAAQDPRTAGLARKARSTLEVVLAEDSPVQTEFRKDLDNDAYHALRRRLADSIAELVAALNATAR